jgi:membrane complex biogenesis BtpA family protein
MSFATLFPPSAGKPVIGMIHLPPLPGSPRHAPSATLAVIRDAALRDADALAAGRVAGLMVENFGDVPFYPGRVPAHTVAFVTAIAAAVRERFPDLPLGINVLRNDGRSALAVAAAVGAQFVRVNVLTGARVADQGLIQGIAHDLLRDRAALGPAAADVRILADVDVKHSAPLAPVPLESEVEDLLTRGLADALVVSGTGTGKATDPAHLARAKAAAGSAPVLVGSGVSEATLRGYLPHADGFIVGTAFKPDNDPRNAIDPARVRRLMELVHRSPV